MIRLFVVPSLITLLFLYLFFKLVPLADLKKALETLSFSSALLSFLLYSLSQIFRSLRWKILIDGLSLRDVFLINSANIFLNNLLPARTGELSWFYYASRLGVKLRVSLWSFAVGRFYDLVAMVVSFFLLELLVFGGIRYLLLLVLVGVLSVALWELKALLPERGKFKELKGFLEREFGFSKRVALLFLSTASFLTKGMCAFALVVPLVKIEPSTFILSFIGGELTTVLPVHGFMGYGTYEAGFTIASKLTEMSTHEALKVGFLVHTFLLVSSTLWGVPSIWLLHTFSRKSP